MNASGNDKAKQNATTISAFKKLTHLSQLSEDDFRDKVIRPVYLRKGLRDGRELCGPDEEGKDCIFVEDGKIKRLFYAVQTKKGTLNMSREPKQNVGEAIAQLRLALQVQYPLLQEHKKIRPDFVVLCVSGKANTAARKHIIEELSDNRIMILDANDLIPEIDEYYPEYWYGIDADKFPYYNNLKQELAAISDVVLFEDSGSSVSALADRYVPLYVYRLEKEIKRYRGKTFSVPKFDTIPVAGLLKRKETLIAIVGSGGAGKTTALRRLTYQIVEDAIQKDKPAHIPVYLRAKDVAQDSTRLLDLAGAETKRIAVAKNPCFTTDDLAGGKVTLLIDALDEVNSESGRQLVLDKIHAFNVSYPECRVLLTSRTEAFSKAGELATKFAKYEVSSLSKEQVEQLVKKLVHVRSLPSETAQETLRKLKDVHGVTMNPLLVTIFVATSDYNRQDVPANITEVFKKYTEMMLGRWDQTKGFSQQYKYKVKDHLLQRLALHMHQANQTSIGLHQCRQLIEDELKNLGQETDFAGLWSEISERSCLLRFEGDNVEFRHLLFQEYFAGRGLRSLEELTAVIHDKWWGMPAVFYFGENPANQSEINALMSRLSTQTPLHLYHAAIALGLSTQACYLSKIGDRTQCMKWVIESLSSSMEGVISSWTNSGDAPVLGFALYYSHAKDAVASALIERVFPLFTESHDTEIARFWCLIGLIESGQLETVYNTIRQFRPQDTRLLFAISLACMVIEGLSITTPKNRDFAKKIQEHLAPKVQMLATTLAKELGSLMLEVQQGKLKALPPIAEGQEPTASE